MAKRGERGRGPQGLGRGESRKLQRPRTTLRGQIVLLRKNDALGKREGTLLEKKKKGDLLPKGGSSEQKVLFQTTRDQKEMERMLYRLRCGQRGGPVSPEPFLEEKRDGGKKNRMEGGREVPVFLLRNRPFNRANIQRARKVKNLSESSIFLYCSPRKNHGSQRTGGSFRT